jgi:plastocyanin
LDRPKGEITMRTRSAAAALVVLVGSLLVLAPPATAGGGCHEGLTEGTGPTVTIVDACFGPAIVRAEPGDTITFVNNDTFAHNVGGSGWGHYDNLAAGDRFSATFADAGLYPFACTLHQGMVGVVVVGDALGAGDGLTVANGVAPGPDDGVSSGAGSDASGRSVLPAAIALVIGVALGFGAASLRLRRTRAAVPA